jgi:HEAT repeat protein
MTCRSTFLTLCLSLGIGTGVSAQRAQVDVRDVVRGSSFPRGYVELSASFDASVTPQLIAMLNSNREEEHWIRVAGMLGVVGDERAVDALIEFVERPVDTLRLSRAHNDARNEAIRALGFLVHRRGNERGV